MKKIIADIKTFLIAFIGLIGGGYWAYVSNWQIEPLILLIISFVEIVGFLILKGASIEDKAEFTNIDNQQNIKNKGRIKKQINIQKNEGNIQM